MSDGEVVGPRDVMLGGSRATRVSRLEPMLRHEWEWVRDNTPLPFLAVHLFEAIYLQEGGVNRLIEEGGLNQQQFEAEVGRSLSLVIERLETVNPRMSFLTAAFGSGGDRAREIGEHILGHESDLVFWYGGKDVTLVVQDLSPVAAETRLVREEGGGVHLVIIRSGDRRHLYMGKTLRGLPVPATMFISVDFIVNRGLVKGAVELDTNEYELMRVRLPFEGSRGAYVYGGGGDE